MRNTDCQWQDQKFSACLLSWKRPQNMQRIVDHLRTHNCIDDIIIWNNNPDVFLEISDINTRVINSPVNVKTYGRFLAAYHAKHAYIYTQDDDYLVLDIPKLVQTFQNDSSCIAHGMPENQYTRKSQYIHKETQMAFVGWGGIFQKEWLSVFDAYKEKYGTDDMLQSKADRIFSILLHRKHNTIIMPLETLSPSVGPEALWIQPHFYTEAEQAEDRALDLLGIQRQKSSPPLQSKNISRFVILGTARTGSNFLAETITQHPEIQCFGEVFNPTEISRLPDMISSDPKKIMEWRDQHPLEFLDRLWNISHGKRITGFKFFFPQNQIAKNVIMEDQDIGKIILRRRNVVRQYVSLQIALENNQWGIRDPHTALKTVVHIDPNALQKFTENTHREYAMTIDMIRRKNQQYLEVVYEDMVGPDGKNIFQEIYDFLGVQYVDLQSALLKQHPEPLSELIDNFSEVIAAFTGTSYEYLLHE